MICNTFFSKCTTHLVTYTSSNNCSQINFVLVPKCHFSLVKDAKVIPSECLAPQHKLLITDLKICKQQRQCRMQGPATVTVTWSKLPYHKETLTHGITFHPVTQDSIATTWLTVWDRHCKNSAQHEEIRETFH